MESKPRAYLCFVLGGGKDGEIFGKLLVPSLNFKKFGTIQGSCFNDFEGSENARNLYYISVEAECYTGLIQSVSWRSYRAACGSEI